VNGTRAWLASRHSLHVELAAVLGLYALYEATRGLVGGSRESAVRHADDVVSLEHSLHLFVERTVQHAAGHVPGLVDALGAAYLTAHLAVTGGVLLWLHRRRPGTYPLVRTTLLLASALALVGYLVFPTAPPRLSGIGILDTVSGHAHVNLNRGLVSGLYNPYAAMPSMHTGYAVVIGATLFREARHLVTRLAGLAYPAFVALVIVATGNHFLLDAAAGAAVAAVAALVTALLVTASTPVPTRQRSPLTGRTSRRSPAPVARPAAGIGSSRSCPP
jgi:hypothetical protein